jgi:phospho-N-acetylmuramoyl-pentapeptide-transferase
MALVALMSGKPWILLLAGVVFLAEFASSMLQVLFFKATGRRILPIAPLHHIFEKNGWPETHIVTRFWIVGGLFSALVIAL